RLAGDAHSHDHHRVVPGDPGDRPDRLGVPAEDHPLPPDQPATDGRAGNPEPHAGRGGPAHRRRLGLLPGAAGAPAEHRNGVDHRVRPLHAEADPPWDSRTPRAPREDPRERVPDEPGASLHPLHLSRAPEDAVAIEIVQADITTLAVDAIVNAA